MSIDNKEIFEDYKEMLSKYCYAVADVAIKKDEDGEWYVDGNLEECIGIMGGHFPEEYVAREIKSGDFPFDGVDKEGYWHYEFLLKHNKGDHEEPDYMEILLYEAYFQISFQDQKEIENTIW